jgi:nicotinate dehydrogenase subunit B
MATYLASFNETASGKPAQEALATELERTAGRRIAAISPAGQRFYEGACAVCHAVGGPPLFGSRPSLALNSNVHAATPDNLIQVILHGIMAPVSSDLGYMPAFADSLSDDQLAELVAYVRQQFAPQKPAWTGVRDTIMRIRQGNAG